MSLAERRIGSKAHEGSEGGAGVLAVASASLGVVGLVSRVRTVATTGVAVPAELSRATPVTAGGAGSKGVSSKAISPKGTTIEFVLEGVGTLRRAIATTR